MHKGITYNPMQEETAKYMHEDCNLILKAPTSSGKTISGEQFLFSSLEAGQKAIYLSPLKALTNEKLKAWENLPYKIRAITSDHDSKPTPIVEDLILMTTEALDSRSRGAKNWLKSVGTIVCDESHLLSSPRRGDAFEVGLTRFALLNPKARIIFLSATIPNAEELGEWLHCLNGKKTHVIDTDYQPITHEYHFHEGRENEWDFESDAIDLIKKVRQQHPDEQMLIFVHTISKGHKISKQLGIPFHYSKLSKEERHNIEKAFIEKKISTIVATSTLAWGVNLPADIAFIVGAHRGPADVELYDLKQMAGRSGRYGLSSVGRVYIITRPNDTERVKEGIKKMPPITSQLPGRLYFHICSFIAREAMQKPEIEHFISKTLGGRQHKIYINEAIDFLLQYDAIRKGADGNLFATNLGRAAALMYVDPIDLFYMRRSLADQPYSPLLIAKAFADIPSLAVPSFVPKDLDDVIDMNYGQQTVLASCLYSWLKGKTLHGTATVIVPPFVMDSERWIAALAIAGVNKNYLNDVQLMITNGCDETMLEIVSLPGIGRKRAQVLKSLGITTKKQMLEREDVVSNVLGRNLAQTIIAKIRNPNAIIVPFASSKPKRVTGQKKR